MDELNVSESKPYRSILVNVIVVLSVLVLESYVNGWHFAAGIGIVLGAYFWGWLLFLLIKLILPEVKNYDKNRKRGLYLSTVNWVLIISFGGGLIQRAQQ